MMRPEFGTGRPLTMAGACDACILDRQCCCSGNCWCCIDGKPWDGGVFRSLVALAARRPDLDRPIDGWWSPRHVGLVLASSVLENA